ncbi:hypothetical protein [Nocardiopsis sp. MG754419]|uniref:hypothetical protein n=1 Tax=Nocardiopsis sp. MG754419 TaxID=2259865 RepID=UPI001BA59991|nr:hypothetical protein [Nocardiopsis sp. MG754419]MBR8743014.1 hypothetical protein [Nocardiopsis sp. MG754419]
MTERLLPALSACLDWAHTVDPSPPLGVEALVLLLSAHQDAGATDPGDWFVADVREVAATVRRREELPPLFRESWLTWCDHLVDAGLLVSTESPRRLRTAIAEIDLTPTDTAEPDPEPPPEVAAPLLERLGYGATTDDGPARPYLPASATELDAHAVSCPTLYLAARLSAWTDPWVLLRSGTDDDALGEDDTAEAARELDVSPEEVAFLFSVARSAGLLRTTYLQALPGPAAQAWARETPGAIADAWADALNTMTDLPGPTPFLVLGELFLTGRELSVEELAHVCVEPDPAAHLPRVLRVLTETGAIETTTEGRHRITGLGDHCVARRLRACGVEVPRTPPVLGLDAAACLDLVERARPVDTARLLDRWLAGRDPADAARGLLEAGLAPEDPAAFVDAVVARPRGRTVLDLVGEDLCTAQPLR